MKQADLGVGDEYALPTYEPYDAAPLAARVRVVSIDGHGKVTVLVMDPGAKPPKSGWGTLSVKRNERRQVTTRSIACPWEEWADRAASTGAERAAQVAAQRASHDEYERALADRVTIDAGRLLPDAYDEEYFYAERDAEERVALRNAYVKARGLGPYLKAEEITPLLVDLPAPVLRDVVATDAHRRSGSPGTVSSIFLRSAELLEVARIASLDRTGGGSGDTPQPGRLIGEPDIAFVQAVRENIAAAGGDLLLPPVPVLPDWVRGDERAVAPVFGWLRVAVADTSGDLLHSSGCSSVRSRPVLVTDHRPWWQIMLAGQRQLCSRCGGPGVRDLVPMAGFAAAVDVWQARGRTLIERWQQAAFQRLLAATATARAQILEPDVTLAHRVVQALADGAPADEGWTAFAVLTATAWNKLGDRVKRLTPQTLESASALIRERLTALETVLPHSLQLSPWTQSGDVEVLRERYFGLKERLESIVPNLDRLLFTLPGS